MSGSDKMDATATEGKPATIVACERQRVTIRCHSLAMPPPPPIIMRQLLVLWERLVCVCFR